MGANRPSRQQNAQNYPNKLALLERTGEFEGELVARPTIGEACHTVTRARQAGRAGVRTRVFMGRGVAEALGANL